MQIRATPVTLGAAVGALVLWQANGPASRATVSVARDTIPVLSPSVPGDLPANPTQADAVAFAWRSFVALNWPAVANARGVPDTSKRIGQPGQVVWQTWKAPEEIFYANGRRPPSWNQYGGTLPPECKGAASGSLVLQRDSKAPANSANNAVRRAKEAIGGTLTDQHGNLARFEIRMNQTIFDAIIANTYYNIEGQNRTKFVPFPADVMEVKASWRVLTNADAPEVKARFARRDAWIYTPPSGRQPASCVKQEVGLVGLHISHKTAGRPEWIWVTFEQVDNVPPFKATPPTGRTLPYSFNNPACPVTKCRPDTTTERNGKPTGIPTQVTRVVNIGQAAQQANPQWQRALAAVPGSAFQYYQLIDVQWPKTPGQLPAGDPTPGLVANTTMETYVPQSSCLHCHHTATIQSGRLSSDYSFMLAEAHTTARRAGQ